MHYLRTMLLVATVLAAGCLRIWALEEGEKAPKENVDLDAASATHEEIEPLDIEFGDLTALALDPQGRLLACDAESEEIKVISPQGKQVASFKPGFGPEAIDVAENGTIYCGGKGQLAILSPEGEVLKTVEVPEEAATPVSETRRARSRPQRVSGIAVSDKDLFVAFGSGWSLGSKSKLFRFDRDLENPELLAENLRGCCQRCDIAVHDGALCLAENSAHRVVLYDREGEVLEKWGERSRTDIQGFGACCNPMNVCFDGQGVLYTAEAGPGRVKCYTTGGKYLGLVGYVGVERFTRAGHLAASCSNMAIAATPDGRRVYVMDYKGKLIRVLQKKS